MGKAALLEACAAWAEAGGLTPTRLRGAAIPRICPWGQTHSVGLVSKPEPLPPSLQAAVSSGHPWALQNILPDALLAYPAPASQQGKVIPPLSPQAISRALPPPCYRETTRTAHLLQSLGLQVGVGGPGGAAARRLHHSSPMRGRWSRGGRSTEATPVATAHLQSTTAANSPLPPAPKLPARLPSPLASLL